MTSLQHQLEKLKKAPTRALAVERDNSSLLFNKKEAASHDREDFYKIGMAGLLGMKALDDDFDMYEPQLFTKKKQKYNRAMLGKEEAEELNQQLEAMLLRLSPYFHHQCCRQVLEWLIHNYQVHTYNAESLFLAFLPYHNVNSFGRLIHILKFNSPDMKWLAEYQKDSSSIPLKILCRACQSGHSYWLISAISSFIQRANDLLEKEYVDAKMCHYFTFIASLYGTLVENQAGKVDDQLLHRLVPFLGIALKSKQASFKAAGSMLLCSLAMNVSLGEELAQNCLKLLLHKIKPEMCELALQTATVICERVGLEELPRKSTLSMVYRSEELQLVQLLRNLMSKCDASAFLVPFRKVLIEGLRSGEETEWHEHFTKCLVESLDLEGIGEAEAAATFGLLLDWLEEAGLGREERILPRALGKQARAMAIRFPQAFDGIRAKRGAEGISRLMEECRIQSHEVGQLDLAHLAAGKKEEEGKGRRRKRKSDGTERARKKLAKEGGE